MNYQKIYDQIVEKARSENRKKSKIDYYERHHIIPKCLNGSNEKSNLVLLTAKEHFICHKLLAEIYPCIKGLHFALHRMMFSKYHHKRDYRIGSREYERFKIKSRKVSSELHKGKIISEETKNKLRNKKVSLESRLKMSKSKKGSKQNLSKEQIKQKSIKMSGINNPMYNKGYLNKGERNGRYNKIVTQETRDKISKARKENPTNLSIEVRKLFSENFSGDKNPMYNSHRIGDLNPFYGKKHTDIVKSKMKEKAKNRDRIKCPHCDKIMDASNAKRWHFDNCKIKRN